MCSSVFLRAIFTAFVLAGCLQAAGGISVSVTPAGAYDISFAQPAWRFGGNLEGAPANITTANGSDALGDYSEISFDYVVDVSRHAAIRSYAGRQAVIFSIEYKAAAANIAPFPNLSRYPSLPYHLTYTGFFAIPSFPGFGN